jgi:hypothetical protein
MRRKFVDSSYYSESEFSGGAVTVSFSTYLPLQAMHFHNAPPTSVKRAADRWSLRNFLPRSSSLYMVEKAKKSHWARFEVKSVFGLENVDRWNPIRTSALRSRYHLMRFLGFSNHEMGASRQEISKWSTVCSTSSRSGWSVVRSASLAKVSTSKKRPSPHLHIRVLPTQSNKASPRTLQTAIVYAHNSSKKLEFVCLILSMATH